MGVTRRPDGAWRARWIGDDGREVSKHFRTKREAQLWEGEQRSKRAQGTWVNPNDKTTVSQFAWQWAKGRPFRPSTARNVAGMIRNHISMTPLGSRRLSAVRPSEIQVWVTSRAALMAPSRLRVLVNLLRSIFKDAVLDGLIVKSPVVRLSMPSMEQARIVPLSVAEVMTLADAVPQRNRAMIMTQATTGLRLSELLALRVEDVDFLRRTLRIEFQYGDHNRVRVELKTPRSKRTIPLPTVTAEALAAHIANFPPGDDGTLFVTSAGNGYRANYYTTKVFKAAVDRAGLPQGTSSHDLRHFYASQLLEAGESVVTVSDRLGHANAQMVLS